MVEGTWTVVREIASESVDQTRELAQWLAPQLRQGVAVALVGELGAGKTTFVRGIVESMGFTGRVRSPSYALVHSYPTKPPITHADLYRLSDPDELVALDLDRDRERGVLLVEWADRLEGEWGKADWRIEFDIPLEGDEESRRIRLLRSGEGAA